MCYDSRTVKLVVFILNKEDLLDEVLAAYVEAEVPGATILDSEGMGRFLTYEVPLFASFKEFMKGNKPYNKTIISVVDKEETVRKLEELIEKVCGPLSEPGTGVLFTVPIDYVRGLRQPEEDS
jgi:nitrogen regulatory protein P-II 1